MRGDTGSVFGDGTDEVVTARRDDVETSRNNVEFLLTDQSKIKPLKKELADLGYPVGGIGNAISNIVHTQGWVHCHSAASDASGVASPRS